jgi:hypothetical protein
LNRYTEVHMRIQIDIQIITPLSVPIGCE